MISGAPRATLLAAVVANVLGWVLPAISEERGFEAFFVALCPPYIVTSLDVDEIFSKLRLGLDDTLAWARREKLK